MNQYPQLAQYNGLVAANLQYVLQFMMWTLLSTPLLVFCRHLAVLTIPAYALHVALFTNPWVSFANEAGVEAVVNNAAALKSFSILGGLLWYMCSKP